MLLARPDLPAPRAPPVLQARQDLSVLLVLPVRSSSRVKPRYQVFALCSDAASVCQIAAASTPQHCLALCLQIDGDASKTRNDIAHWFFRCRQTGTIGPAGPGSIAGTLIGPFTVNTNGSPANDFFGIRIDGPAEVAVLRVPENFVAPLAGQIFGVTVYVRNSPTVPNDDITLIPTIKNVEQPSVSTSNNLSTVSRVVPVSPPVAFNAGAALGLKFSIGSSVSTLQVYLRVQM